MLLEISVFIVTGILTIWLYCYIKSYLKLKMIPSPSVWPLIGNALKLKNPEEIIYVFPKLMKDLKSKTFRLQIGFRTVLVTADYTLIERILGSPTLVRKTYFQLTPWLGHGLLTSSEKKWKNMRKIITPTFYFQILEQFLNVFNANGTILINKFKKQIGKDSVDVFPFMSLCSLDIICETAMGISINAQLDELSQYAQYVDKQTDIVQTRAFTPLYDKEFIYKRTRLCSEEQTLLKIFHEQTDSVIKTRREKLKQETANKASVKVADKVDFGKKKKVPFLDMLLQSTIDGRPLTDIELRDEVSTFMFAGHETTAGAMSFTLFTIANHPDVQKKVFEEIHNIFGNNKDKICTTADITKMRYLEMVIKESLRMYPTIPLISRTLSENVDYNGTTIPRGLRIQFLVYGIHYDPEYYPDPEKFDPERFSPEHYNGKQPYSFIPFSAGPRNCIGQKYAMMEMKCLLSMILRQFELKPATPFHNLELRSAVTLKSLNGIKIAFAERAY